MHTKNTSLETIFDKIIKNLAVSVFCFLNLMEILMNMSCCCTSDAAL